MTTLRLKTPHTEADWNAYHGIRERVLWEARGCVGVYDRSHPDEYQEGNHPKLLLLNNEALGVVRIDLNAETGEAVLRRVAIAARAQGKGYGRELIRLAEAFAREAGCERLVSNVSLDAVGFYRKMGFVFDSDQADSDERNPRMVKRM